MNVRSTGLVIGLAAALTLTGAAPGAAAADPCAGTSKVCSPADVAKEPDGKKVDDKPRCSGERPGKPGDGKKAPGITQAQLAKALAAELGVGYDRALRAVKELDALNERGRVDPDSPGFREVARHLGVSPRRLLQALRNVKLALAESGRG